MVVEAYKDLPIGTSNIDYLISAVTTISASKKLGAVENPRILALTSRWRR